MEVLAAEFLPQDKQLFLLLADGDCNIHVLEFNPEGMPTQTTRLSHWQPQLIVPNHRP